jgi:uncharacterized lipoprotein YajG
MLKALLISLAAGTLLAGCATTAQSPPDVAARPAAKSLAPLNCLTTGTRIALKDGECANVVGRAYTRGDIDRTGATTIGEALRMLDPALH